MTISPSRGNVTGTPGGSAATRALRWVALIGVLMVIGYATLRPEWDAPRPDVALMCLRCGELGGPDLILNVLLFAPLGVVLASFGVRSVPALGIGFALAAGIEVTQVFLPGRSTTLRDVLCNAGGAWLGAFILPRLAGLLAPGRATLLRLVVATAAAVATVGATGLLFEFDASDPPFYGHWSPEQDHLAHWTGTVREARIDGLPLPSWRIDDAATMRAVIEDGFRLDIEGTGGGRTEEINGIVTLSDANDREILLIGSQGTDLVVRVRRRASWLRLNAPVTQLPRLMIGAEDGAPLTMRIEASVGGICATVNTRTECAPRAAAGSSWILLLPDRGARPTARILLNALTLAALAFPVGLLLAGVTTRQSAVSLFVLVLGIAVVAPLSGLAVVTILEWLGLGAGLVAGHALNRLVTKAGATASAAPA